MGAAPLLSRTYEKNCFSNCRGITDALSVFSADRKGMCRWALVLIGISIDPIQFGEETEDDFEIMITRVHEVLDGENSVVEWNEENDGSMMINPTRGDAYSYERQKGLVIIEGTNLLEPRVLSASHFRTVDVSWISEKLIHIRVGVSRLAVAEAIYDVVEGAWIYQESLQYVEE